MSEIENLKLHPSTSLTHEHILSLLNTELKKNQRGKAIHVLDVGCGNGVMLSYLYRNLKLLWPEKEFKVFGFDVGDHTTQAEGFFDKGLVQLKKDVPDYPWKDSLHLITQNADWPFEDNFFDLVISNQVLEHIFTRDHFFGEIKRCLKVDGFSCHLAPVRECIYDGHVYMPWVHRFKNQKILKYFMFIFGLMGFGSYWYFKRESKEKFSFKKLYEWCDKNSSYVIDSCNYMTKNELLNIGGQHGFKVNFSHTSQYYWRKFNQMRGVKSSFDYSGSNSSKDRYLLPILMRTSSITVNLINER